ncbi:MAG: hypothetical protein QXD69_06120, partial [Candidatus Bathyarchaeia archaeon]
GKSYLLTKILSPGSIVINDITGWGLERIVSEIYMKDTYPYIVIPDFVKVASRKQSYESFLGLMNALLEEGVSQIRKYDLEVKFEKPVRCGILTGITPDYLEKRVKLINVLLKKVNREIVCRTERHMEIIWGECSFKRLNFKRSEK